MRKGNLGTYDGNSAEHMESHVKERAHFHVVLPLGVHGVLHGK